MVTQMKLPDSFNLAPTHPKELLYFGKMKVCGNKMIKMHHLKGKCSNINKYTTIAQWGIALLIRFDQYFASIQ